MPKEETIRGKVCRFYAKGLIWISKDGTLAAEKDRNTGKYKVLHIQSDDHGKYVIHSWGHTVSIAKAVINCFCPPNTYPKGMIKFKDGNMANCCAANLEWEPYHYKHTTALSVNVSIGHDTYMVCKDGTVWLGKNQKTPCYSLIDSDTGLWYVIQPSLGYYDKSPCPHYLHMDEVMKSAGYIQGDDSNLTSPAILHKDNDWMNFACGNLEWVEKTDPRHIAYMKELERVMMETQDRLNNKKP